MLIRARWTALALVALLLPMCQRELPTREPEPVVSAPENAPPAVPTESTRPEDAPVEAEAALPDASDDVAAKTGFGPAPATTPGKILCGDRQCDLASEVCCENESEGVAECVPKPAGDQYACEGVRGTLYEKRCDEKADCPGTQACCTTWGCSGGCPPVNECSDMPCRHGPVEQCLPGGACSPGFRCVRSESSRTGSCSWEKASVACGKKRCSGAEPVCCWNAKTHRGECAKACADERSEDMWQLACTSPDDCGGYPCANMVPSPAAFTSCMGAYDVPDRSSVVFCRSLKDCPRMNMLGKPKACLPDKSFPGNAKTCRYPVQ